MNERERLISLLARCHSDPDLFNSAILGRAPLWWRQREVAESVVKYRQTICYSGNATGKDYLLGDIIPWWLYTRANSLVIVTGPSQTLLGSVTWKEVRRAVDNAVIPLGAKVTTGVKTSPQVCAVDARSGWQALGYSTTSVERASGQHERKVLVIIEEASGVLDEIWYALDSLKYVRLLAIGNPIRPDGEFVRRIRMGEEDARLGRPPAESINAIRIPSTDSPDIDLEESPRGLADRTFLRSAYRMHGEDGLWVRSHIKAEIPIASSEALIPGAWLDWAATVIRPAYPINHPIHQTRRIAVDLGEGVGRDSSVVLVRDDLGVLQVTHGNAMGLPEAAAEVSRLRQIWNVPDERISYDSLGIGRDFPHHLWHHGVTAVAYAGEGRPLDPAHFTNLRTEAAWNLKNRLDPTAAGGAAPFAIPIGDYWERLKRALEALTYECGVRTQVQLLPKKQWSAKLGHSPDVADALIQSFAFSRVA
ncbi:MAG: hypothetical protein BGO49_04410 [Planctomycetales bacterium 71-10]|nr:MAG: hypothetical protein BGO49_04410 [Planctomycetales bacterium 71-10]